MMWFSNYKEALEYLTRYTGQKFTKIKQWQEWYAQNKAKLYWDNDKQRYLIGK